MVVEAQLPVSQSKHVRLFFGTNSKTTFKQMTMSLQKLQLVFCLKWFYSSRNTKKLFSPLRPPSPLKPGGGGLTDTFFYFEGLPK